MSYHFIPAIEGECLPCELPSELVARIAARSGARPMLKVQVGDTIRAYSRDDPGLSDGDLDRIRASARSTVLIALSSGDLGTFVRCDATRAYYRVPSGFWSWWATRNLSNSEPLPQVYEASPFDGQGDARFLGATLMVAKADGDRLIGAGKTSAPSSFSTANENEQPRASDQNGCQGRPSVLPFCERLMRERHAAGLTQDTVRGEARAIIEDFKSDARFQHLVPCGVKAITNGLGSLYRQLTGKLEFPKPNRDS